MAVLQDDLRVGSRRDIGGLALFAIVGDGSAPALMLSATEAFHDGLLEVTELENPEVPTLVATVTGTVPVLLVEGEILLGGAQDRTLNVTVLCEAAAATRIPVSCVESGRWGGRQRRAQASSTHTSAALRAAKLASIQEDEASRMARSSDQGRVWRDIDAYAARHDVQSSTSALEDVNLVAVPDLAAALDRLEPVPGQVGVAAMSGGRVIGLDVFDSERSLGQHLRQIVSGYVMDAAVDRDGGGTPDDVKAFLAAVDGAAVDVQPGVGLGEELHLRAGGLTGSGLRHDGRLLHLAAFALVSA